MRSAIRPLFLAFLLLLATASIAGSPDFSGSYTLTGGNRRLDTRKAVVVTMNVVQAPTELEFTTVKDGQRTVNRVRLDGKEGVYNGLRGPAGKCKGHINGKTLILDVLYTVHANKTQYPDKPSITMSVHLKEIWELSADLKTLTIRGEEELLPPYTGQFPPWTEIYTRN